MKITARQIKRVKNHPFLAAVVVLAAVAVFLATCMDAPERIVTTEDKPVPPKKNKDLLGTWVSEQWPEQKFFFTEDEVRYRELKYSVVLEGSGTYTYTPDGTVQWTITWYSGDSTQWNGHLKGDRIIVEFQNSWEDIPATDTLIRVR